MRAHVRDRLVTGAEVPLACGGKNHVPGPRRLRDRRNLDDAVRIVGVDRRVVSRVGVDAAEVRAQPERVAGESAVAEPAPLRSDDGRAAVAGADLTAV